MSCVMKVEVNIEKHNSEFIKKPLLDEHFDIILFCLHLARYSGNDRKVIKLTGKP